MIIQLNSSTKRVRRKINSRKNKMKQFKFDGEDLILNDRQLEFIVGALEKRGFQNETVTAESVGEINDNYGSTVKRFTVKGDDRILKMIAKIAPSNSQERAFLRSKVTFHNECVMYSKVLPKFAELERNADISDGERLRFSECFGILPEEPHEIILLEDLNESNFCILDKFKPLNDNTVRLVLENFAKFHALSFVLKHDNLDTYKSFVNELIHPWWDANIIEGGMNTYFCCVEADVLNFVNNGVHKQIIEGSMTRMTKNFEISRNNDGFLVIHQGDAWTNNIMFKMKNNKAVECCMIDYQISSESNPAADILYMIFNCTDYATRSAHYFSWIDHYYDHLVDRLRKFGLSSDEVYPREILNKDLKRMGKIAIGQAIIAASVLVRETHEAAEVKQAMKDEQTQKMVLSNLGESSLKRFREKLDALLKSYEEIGFDY